MTRDAALHRVRVLLAGYDDDPLRDLLFNAIVDYGHACASETLNACQAVVRESFDAAGILGKDAA